MYLPEENEQVRSQNNGNHPGDDIETVTPDEDVEPLSDDEEEDDDEE